MTDQSKAQKKASLLTNEQKKINELSDTLSREFFADNVIYSAEYDDKLK